MSDHYEEVIEGESMLRFAPGLRHERICQRLHLRVRASLPDSRICRLLEPRAVVQFGPGTLLRPDLTMVTAATGKPWLVAEVVDADDHRVDTVVKKNIYEQLNLPRLWMVDPRYDNLEIYHATPYGMALKKIIAGKETLQEKLLPLLHLSVEELFGD